MFRFFRSRPKPRRIEPEIYEATPYRLIGAMLTDPGKIRANNEDTVCFVLPQANAAAGPRDALFLVADGMGGHAAGEVASRIAADIFHRTFTSADHTVSVRDLLAACFRQANNDIIAAAMQNPDYKGMGTTCTAVAIRDNRAWLGHIGDSRAYMFRQDKAGQASKFEQISVDHTLVAELVRRGTMTPEEAALSPERNVILRALGTAPTVEPELTDDGKQLRPFDRFVLCSDGLSDLVSDEDMHRIVRDLPPHEACQALLQAALDGGGHDNISVGVFGLTDRLDEPDTIPPADRPTRRTEGDQIATGQIDVDDD